MQRLNHATAARQTRRRSAQPILSACWRRRPFRRLGDIIFGIPKRLEVTDLSYSGGFRAAKDKTSDMPPGAFSCRPVLCRKPTNITKIADLRAGGEQHQYPLVDRID